MTDELQQVAYIPGKTDELQKDLKIFRQGFSVATQLLLSNHKDHTNFCVLCLFSIYP